MSQQIPMSWDDGRLVCTSTDGADCLDEALRVFSNAGWWRLSFIELGGSEYGDKYGEWYWPPGLRGEVLS